MNDVPKDVSGEPETPKNVSKEELKNQTDLSIVTKEPLKDETISLPKLLEDSEARKQPYTNDEILEIDITKTSKSTERDDSSNQEICHLKEESTVQVEIDTVVYNGEEQSSKQSSVNDSINLKEVPIILT